MSIKNNAKGFTLLETIIYIALFSVIMTGVFATIYQIFSGSDNLINKSTTTEEGNFVLKKLSWILSNIDLNNPPAVNGSGCTQTLTVIKNGFSSNPIVIWLNTVGGINFIEMSQGSGPSLPITTANASTSCLMFSIISGNPLGITATATIDGTDFSITRYVRQ